MFLLLLRASMISVRFLHLLSLTFLTLHISGWLKLDSENLGSCHGVIEFMRECMLSLWSINGQNNH